MADLIYNNTINEFTDWVTGEDSLTNTDATGGLKVSGEQIRKLLQKHIKSPVYIEKDETTAMYQIFSSKEAHDTYVDSGKTRTDLLISEFKGPSSYSMKIAPTSDTTLYVREAPSAQCKISYTWDCIDENGLSQDTSVTITTTITNVTTKKVLATYSTVLGSSVKGEELDIYNYLTAGTNSVSILISSNLYSAITQKDFIVNVVSMQISLSNFDWWQSIALAHSNVTSCSTSFDINYTSNQGSATLYVYLDGKQIDSIALQSATTAYTLKIPNSVDIPLLGAHRLVLYAEASIGNKIMLSNVLLSLFTVAIQDISNPGYTLLHINNYHSFANDTLDPTPIINLQYSLLYTQYDTLSLLWGIWYYTLTNLTMHIWLKYEGEETATEIGTFTGVTIDTQQDNIVFTLEKAGIASLYFTVNNNKDTTPIASVIVSKFAYNISETQGYVYKLNAKDKSNEVKTITWTPTGTTPTPEATLYNIAFTDTSGWYKDALRMQGIKSYVEIPNFPVHGTSGTYQFTFEIEFQSEYVADEEDVIIDILGCIKIHPTSADIVSGDGSSILTTNFKAGERTKIAFTRFGSSPIDTTYKNLCTIVTDGILERAAEIDSTVAFPNTGTVTFGKSNSGVRIFNFRYYRSPQYWKASYDNWIYDSTTKSLNIKNNDVWIQKGTTRTLDYDKCSSKMEIINLVGGDLATLLKSSDKVSTTLDSLERVSPTNAAKNFVIKNCTIRTHGQSTITYPIKSYKIWSNKTLTGAADPEFIPSNSDTSWKKNMYRMKDNSIPANKWVLQANFADSSGTHNGSIQRLIHDTWYNATFTVGSKKEFKLRTPPQLFSTSLTITIDLVPSDDPDYEEYQTVDKIAQGYNSEGALWSTYFPKTAFPYEIRTSTDSFPCVIFYKLHEEDAAEFLGQYVFMDDKKSDYLYGERSIYKIETDPFCLAKANSSLSIKSNRIWNNKDVLRIEILSMDNALVNYAKNCSYNYQENFDTESAYELIYPDPDDLNSDAERDETFKPFVDFHNWVVSTKDNLSKFEAEAYKHLDLHKMAAYYVFFLMFGMVDSVERNALVKTYDGKHFWYEVWDADIACGNKNTGGIRWDPGTDRTTIDVIDSSGTVQGAFSGYNSVLWNNLERWTYWTLTIVPTVAEALYQAGLKYDNVISMFDDEYQNKWCEYIYDSSGEYKYLKSTVSGTEDARSSYLPWLLGARNSHRHWWLSTSMDYWYARWGVGSFREHQFYITAYNTAQTGGTAKLIKLIANEKSSFAYGILQGGLPLELTEANAGELVTFDIKNTTLHPKVPFFIYGATAVRSLDLSVIASKLDGIEFNLSTAEGLATNAALLELLIGVPEATLEEDKKASYDKKLSGLNTSGSNLKNFGLLTNLKTLDITGQYPSQATNLPSSLPSTLLVLKAAGSHLLSISASNNDFTTLEIPNVYLELDSSGNVSNTSTLQSVAFKNCTLPDTIKFYNTDRAAEATTEEVNTYDDEGNQIYNDDGTPAKTTIITHAAYLKETTTVNFTSLVMSGTTCKTENGKKLFLTWLHSIEIKDGKAYIGNTLISSTNVNITNIEWIGFTYDDVLTIGTYLYNQDSPNFVGRIELKETEILDADKLTALTSLFGASVFILNSAGLVIDYPRDIAIINVIGATYNPDQGYYEFSEGGEALLSLSYTRFALSTDTDYEYKVQYGETGTDVIQSDGDSLSNKPNVSMKATDDAILNRKNWGIVIKESTKDSISGDYTLYVCESSSKIPFLAEVKAKIVVHPVKYPSAIHLVSLNNSRAYNEGVELLTSSASCAVNLAGEESTATIKAVLWSILLGNVKLTADTPSYFNANTFAENNAAKTSLTDTFSIGLASIPDAIDVYTLLATATFYNDTVRYTMPLYLMYDPAVVTNSSGQTGLFKTLTESGLDITGNTIYMSDLVLCTNLTFTEDASFLLASTYNTLLEEGGVKLNIFNYLTNLLTVKVNSTAVCLFPSLVNTMLAKCAALSTLDWSAGVLKGDPGANTITLDFSNKPKSLTSLYLPATDNNNANVSVTINNSSTPVALSLIGTIDYLYITGDISNKLTTSLTSPPQVKNLYLTNVTGDELGNNGKYAVLFDPAVNSSLLYLKIVGVASTKGDVGTQLANWLYDLSNLNIIVVENSSFLNVTYMHFLFKNFYNNSNKKDFYDACSFTSYTLLDPDEYGDLIAHLELRKTDGSVAKLDKLTTLADLTSTKFGGDSTADLVLTSGADANAITSLTIIAHTSMTTTKSIDLLSNSNIRDIRSILASSYNLNLKLVNYSTLYLKDIQLGAPSSVYITGSNRIDTLSLTSIANLNELHVETDSSSSNASMQYFLQRASTTTFQGYLKRQSCTSTGDLSNELGALSTLTNASRISMYDCSISASNTHLDEEVLEKILNKWGVSPYNCTFTLGSPTFKFQDVNAKAYITQVYNNVKGTSKAGLTLAEILSTKVGWMPASSIGLEDSVTHFPEGRYLETSGLFSQYTFPALFKSSSLVSICLPSISIGQYTCDTSGSVANNLLFTVFTGTCLVWKYNSLLFYKNSIIVILSGELFFELYVGVSGLTVLYTTDATINDQASAIGTKYLIKTSVCDGNDIRSDAKTMWEWFKKAYDSGCHSISSVIAYLKTYAVIQ